MRLRWAPVLCLYVRSDRKPARTCGCWRPSYFKERPEPKKPQDLVQHECTNLRLPTHGGLYAWEFEKSSRELRVRVEGQLTFNGTAQMLNAALAGFGLAYVPDDLVQPSAAFALLVEALRYRD